MKTYARQVPPEYQESPYDWGGDCYDNIIIAGNRGFKAHTTPEYDKIARYFDEMASDYDDANYYYTRKFDEWGKYAGFEKHKRSRQTCSIKELLRGYGFSRPRGGEWSTKERHAWRELLEGEADISDDGFICAALELVTGKPWDCTCIRGCCQSDWNYLYYPADEWDRRAIDCLEAEYFNTGTEWIVHDSDDAPDGPEDISGYSVYCYGYGDDDIKAEIADAAGADVADVVLYKFADWTRSASWTVA